MKKLFGCLLTVWTLSLTSEAQISRYIIRFKDKGVNPYSFNNPSAYLSQRAIDRRTSYSIAIDSTDLPVTPRYIDSVRLAGPVTILNASKWLNAVSIQTTDNAALAKINSFPFVQSVSGIALRTSSSIPGGQKSDGEKKQPSSTLREMDVANFFNYGLSFDQVHIHNGEFLHNIGLRGQNMVIGMLDGGFNNYLTVKAFDSARANGQILSVYDFVARDGSVNEDNPHGMQCLSTIAANIPGQFVGTAPKAGFHLFRTEDASAEYPIEEFNWVCGAERVDSAGGNVISSSVGYSTFNSPFTSASHSYADLDGNTTTGAIGADLAAKKGLLVINSAGNEGNNSWKFIVTPADGDSVLAVGAVTSSGTVANFSSYGPSSDGRIKPDVASVGVGTIIQFPNNTVGDGNGTSFACPNMAGLVTCLWQGFPEFNNIKIINAVRQAGNRVTAPDDRVGYGVPDMKKALVNLIKDFSTASASVSNCTVSLQWTSKDVSSMKYEIERRIPGQTSFLKIAERKGTGNVFSTNSYQLQDVLSGVENGIVTYRVKQIADTSKTGFTFAYIDTVTVDLQSPCINENVIDVTIFENPAKDQFTVRVTTPTASSNITIRIFNAGGQLLNTSSGSKIAGTAFFENISLLKFAKGTYYVSVYDNGKLLTTKELIKL